MMCGKAQRLVAAKATMNLEEATIWICEECSTNGKKIPKSTYYFITFRDIGEEGEIIYTNAVTDMHPFAWLNYLNKEMYKGNKRLAKATIVLLSWTSITKSEFDDLSKHTYILCTTAQERQEFLSK